MTPNPYDPPMADVENSRGNTERRPSPLLAGCALFAGSVLFRVASLIQSVYRGEIDETPGVLLGNSIGLVIVFTITVFLVYKVLCRKNWARWGSLAYLCLSWLASYLLFQTSGTESNTSTTVLDDLAEISDFVGVALLFVPSSSKWFSTGSAGTAARETEA